MHEIIHLSLSSTANHLHTHFYNAQESYFVYTDEDSVDSKVDPHVLFRQGKTFTPRALIWELRGGYGSMRQFNTIFYDDKDSSSNDVDNSGVWNSTTTETMKELQIQKSPYQSALDLGLYGSDLPKLNTKSTLYWSDYLNVCFHPKSLLTLPNWEYHPVDYPKGRIRGASSQKNQGFEDFTTGVVQWNELNSDVEYLENHFRPVLEQCDSLSGVSLATEIDSAWGGFSTEVLQSLKDDYISKTITFTWGLFDDGFKLSRDRQLSRIKSLDGLIQNSDLFIPITKPDIPTSYKTDRFKTLDLSSQWHLTALYNLVYEPISVLSSLRHDKRIPMQSIADAITLGSNRTIASDVKSGIGSLGLIDYTLLSPFGSNDKNKPAHYFSKIGLQRPPTKQKNKASVQGRQQLKSLQDYLNFIPPPVESWDSYFQENKLIAEGTDQAALTRFNCEQPFAISSSTPGGFLEPEDEVYSSLGVTNTPRRVLLDMSDFVSRFVKSEDREELKENLTQVAEQYEWGYESDGESD